MEYKGHIGLRYVLVLKMRAGGCSIFSRFVKDLGLYSIMVHVTLNNGLNLKC